jgi:hypothetical protein
MNNDPSEKVIPSPCGAFIVTMALHAPLSATGAALRPIGIGIILKLLLVSR